MEITKTYGRKRQNLFDAKHETPSIDRLSRLPDELLSHILLFLPTNLSVRTSILSKRWRFVWAGVPSLDFNSGFSESDISLLDMITRVMFQHKVQSLNSFHLNHWKNDNCSDYQFETWIYTLAERNIRDLWLFLHFQFSLPRCLFTCKSLVELVISSCGVIPNSGVVCLPSLKKLYLYGVLYETSESLSNLLWGCPVLEEFDLQFIMDNDLVHCNISSPSIIRLTVWFYFDIFEYKDDEVHYNHDYRLQINIPTLTYLCVRDALSEYLSAGSLPSLVKADLGFKNGKIKKDNFHYSQSVVEFVDRLHNVESLRLSFHCTEIVDSAISASALKFPNLTELYLTSDWRFVSKFLENANNLKQLGICEADELKCWKEPEQVPKCLLSNLTTVIICGFGCSGQELEMVRYFLKSAEVLARMEIKLKCSDADFEKIKDYALQKISLFPQQSKANFVTIV